MNSLYITMDSYPLLIQIIEFLNKILKRANANERRVTEIFKYLFKHDISRPAKTSTKKETLKKDQTVSININMPIQLPEKNTPIQLPEKNTPIQLPEKNTPIQLPEKNITIEEQDQQRTIEEQDQQRTIEEQDQQRTIEEQDQQCTLEEQDQQRNNPNNNLTKDGVEHLMNQNYSNPVVLKILDKEFT